MNRLRVILVLLREQLWVIPSIISLLALALAYWLLTAGAGLLGGSEIWWLYSGDAESARGLLSSLLSGLMTMTSLVVSVTFVILTLAANQLGPRLISTFMADRLIQVVLGIFLGTILYVLVVLRSVDDRLGIGGVPHIAVTIGSALTVLCLFALLLYVHKIARSIIADTVVERVAGDLRRNIEAMLPDGHEVPEAPTPRLMLLQAAPVSLDRSGYVQAVDYGALIGLARRCDALFRVNVRAGHFVLRHGEHISVHAGRRLDESLVEGIRAAFIIGQERSPAQDVEYAIRQLVEIAVRALSAGINDPFTAIAVVDRLGAAIEDLLSRALQPAVLRDDAGAVRVIADRSDRGGLIDAAFDLIRQAAGEHPSVLIRMADILGQLAPVLQREDARGAILRQLDKLEGTVREGPPPQADREAVMARIEQGRAAVEGRSPAA